jgi:hypothetical protein
MAEHGDLLRDHHPPGHPPRHLPLRQKLTGAIGTYNDRCQPFTWTKDADGLIAKITWSKN